jgi:hypothetical protein
MRRDDDSDPDYADYPVADEDGDRPGVEWLGVAGGSHDSRPRLYDPSTGTAYPGRLHHENARVVWVPARGRDVDEAALGHLLRSIDEWTWLSPYARSHLD